LNIPGLRRRIKLNKDECLEKLENKLEELGGEWKKLYNEISKSFSNDKERQTLKKYVCEEGILEEFMKVHMKLAKKYGITGYYSEALRYILLNLDKDQIHVAFYDELTNSIREGDADALHWLYVLSLLLMVEATYEERTNAISSAVKNAPEATISEYSKILEQAKKELEELMNLAKQIRDKYNDMQRSVSDAVKNALGDTISKYGEILEQAKKESENLAKRIEEYINTVKPTLEGVLDVLDRGFIEDVILCEFIESTYNYYKETLSPTLRMEIQAEGDAIDYGENKLYENMEKWQRDLTHKLVIIRHAIFLKQVRGKLRDEGKLKEYVVFNNKNVSLYDILESMAENNGKIKYCMELEERVEKARRTISNIKSASF